MLMLLLMVLLVVRVNDAADANGFVNVNDATDANGFVRVNDATDDAIGIGFIVFRFTFEPF